MNQQFEDDLGAAFSKRASDIPTEASERLRRIDYHPRTSRISPRLTLGALAGVAATTMAVVSVFVLGGATAAFAGWTASPTPAASGQTASAASNCQTQLAALPNTPGTDGWSAVATDVRGQYSLTVYQDSDANAICLTGPSLTIFSSNDGTGRSSGVGMRIRNGATVGDSFSSMSGSTMVGALGSGSIEQHPFVAHMTSDSQGALTVVYGRVAADVTAVTLVRSDGVDVQTSTGNRWFVAWWPGSQDAPSAEITTPGGVSTQTLDTPPPPPPSGSGS